MKRLLFNTCIVVCICLADIAHTYGQKIAVKNNLVHDVFLTLNAGIEYALNTHTSIDLSANYNPWTFGNNKKWKHWSIQPEFRYWIKEPFKSHFVGGTVMAGGFNFAKMKIFDMGNYRHQGNFYGIGASYGYQWKLTEKWHMECNISIGYMRLDYDKYDCDNCGKFMGKDHKNYWGPINAGVSIIYIIQ